METVDHAVAERAQPGRVSGGLCPRSAELIRRAPGGRNSVNMQTELVSDTHQDREGDVELDSSTATISFILPTLNEERFIAATVGQFAAADGSLRFEVIVADGGSTDK